MVVDTDRRQFLRADVEWPAIIIPPNWPAAVRIKSISQAGASIYCQQLPPAGQEFRLEIQPPDRQPLIVTARPIWAVETGSPQISCRFVCGVQFEYISEEDIKFLGDTVTHHQSPGEINEVPTLERDKRA